MRRDAYRRGARVTRDTRSALFWFALGLLVCYGGSRLGVGRVTDPGAGFIFFWSGLILALLSLMVLTQSLREVAAEAPEIGDTHWAKISLVLASLVLYALVLERIGFVLATFVLLSVLLRLSGGTGWLRILGVAGAAALGCFVLFELWLRIRLPKGIFGF